MVEEMQHSVETAARLSAWAALSGGVVGLPAAGRTRRFEPAARRRVAGLLAEHYQGGATIGALADASGYSVGHVRELLLTAGVTPRRRGGVRGYTRSAG
ncbi:helix-turn-helix domain-containing protein [Actinomycetospora endophytica]|uniref:Helix-turn-helix domain-containing protein n=1 Tax=Actinomycetospora endophytica TaxID=2291215 RepID=A0ABS8P5R7_9PSEU|nr:helix-turn-helix domain-containing protein [Actinomycetospora endophytica]MCD2193602.1 helix-turn-helix domain-containing protein [Actinomycetospora endophytica]